MPLKPQENGAGRYEWPVLAFDDQQDTIELQRVWVSAIDGVPADVVPAWLEYATFFEMIDAGRSKLTLTMSVPKGLIPTTPAVYTVSVRVTDGINPATVKSFPLAFTPRSPWGSEPNFILLTVPNSAGGPHHVRRYETDYSAYTTIIASIAGGVQAYAFYEPAQQLFIVNGGTAGKVTRYNADGSNPVDIFSPGTLLGPIAIDPAEGIIFLSAGGQIRRMNLDGTGMVSLTSAGTVVGLALDPVNQFVYYNTNNSGNVRRLSYAGVDTLAFSAGWNINSMTFDPYDGWLWLSRNVTSGSNGTLRRCRPDASEILNVSTASRTFDLSVQMLRSRVVAAHSWNNTGMVEVTNEGVATDVLTSGINFSGNKVLPVYIG